MGHDLRRRHPDWNIIEAVLYSFAGGPKGGTPMGGLAFDAKGNLYGTVPTGGSATGNAGNGVVFKLSSGKRLTYSVVHIFTGADGSQPMAALIPDGKGNFYGTTLIFLSSGRQSALPFFNLVR